MDEHDLHGFGELAGIFDHLSPADFETATSAIEEMVSVNVGELGFRRFVEEQQRVLRLSYAAAAGQLDPVAVIASPSVRRWFLPEDDETMDAYVARLHREAALIGAVWVFVAQVTEVGSEPVEDASGPVGRLDVGEHTLMQGTLQRGVMWYAERLEGPLRQTRVGIMRDESSHLVRPVENDTQRVAYFESILRPTS